MPFDKVIAVRPLQPEKALAPILMTLPGMVIVVRPEQFKKALPPILVTPVPITTFVKPEQLEKALVPMSLIVFGIVIVVMAVQAENAPAPIYLVPAVNVYSVNPLLVASTAYVSAYLMLSVTGREVQPEKALVPMVVTLSGMVIPVRDLHPLNALELMVVTPVPITTLVNPVQPEKAEAPI